MIKKKEISRRKTSGKSGEPISDALRHEFYQSIAEVLHAARSKAYRAIDFTMVEAYWNVGRIIVVEEQQGKTRAAYGKRLLIELSTRLMRDFGKGYDASNLRFMRQFYLTYPICDTVCHKSVDGRSVQLTPKDPAPSFPIRDSLRPELSWSHYRLLIRVEKIAARDWYMNESADQNWPVRVLERQINSLYYERLKMSRDKKPVIEEMLEKTAPLAATPRDFIKDPYVLEFLGLKDNPDFRESDLEQAIIGKLQAFMLELGKGFAFVGRQQRISTETRDFLCRSGILQLPPQVLRPHRLENRRIGPPGYRPDGYVRSALRRQIQKS